VADELDMDWSKVIVEMAPYNPKVYARQFTGGSAGIRSWWKGLRMAGASAKHMLKEAAAQAWQVPSEEITTEKGMLYHKASGKSAHYGEFASAAASVPVPEEVELKELKDFNIIGTSRKNVDGKKIVTGAPMFGVDYKKEGMLYAMIIHPPAFGMKLKSLDASSAKSMSGIKDVFPIKVHTEDYERAGFDITTFNEIVAVVGNSTWEVMKAKKSVQVEWEPFSDHSYVANSWGGKQTVVVPGGLESTSDHLKKMAEKAAMPGNVLRKDGNPETAFKNASQVIERTYSAPFLAHNCMEPMNFFAHVTEGRVEAAGPLQGPSAIEPTLSARLGIPVENIEIKMTRMGGGFGRRAYSHHLIEAALISQQMSAPVKLMYTREDDMTFGIYRPMYQVTYKAGLDENNNLVAFSVKGGGVPESPVFQNRFPAGAVDNYLAESWEIPSNITIGAFRAPRSNFIAGAEQSFLDEVAELAGKDPIEFRLELLKRAKENPVGDRNDYDAERYAGVLELVREKSGWGKEGQSNENRGVAAYFCHATYAAHVLDLVLEDGKPVVKNVCTALDCGIVINPDAAANMAEGAITDGIGNALFGEMTFTNGVAEKTNFDKY
ncbi:MAG: xanthine dehydrogenase family protein molybdopterin-binding subunit, partial [Bacteroidetes bacterium]|nr:xanthine dehydrogenase family protein molybdopterin-binding subunit [Bacteroidota bacterium]